MESLTVTKPKLGFVGAGWIGKQRMRAINKNQRAEMAGVVDPDTKSVKKICSEIPGLQHFHSFEQMLNSDLDGIVIATPNMLHVPQALAAIKSRKAVFCQKPLGRNRSETAKVVETARRHNVLLGVDFSYRHIRAMDEIKKVVNTGELGSIFGIELTFHNAYGPDKEWYYNTDLSGGGCLMDLGIHLIDMLFWIFDEVTITDLNSRIYHKGKAWKSRNQAEDYVALQFVLNNETAVQLSCSWNLSAGKEAVIQARFYGENGGTCFRNKDGSFYDFTAEKYTGTETHTLASPPDDWPGRAAVVWSERLAENNQFDPSNDIYTKVAGVLDQIYQQGL